MGNKVIDQLRKLLGTIEASPDPAFEEFTKAHSELIEKHSQVDPTAQFIRDQMRRESVVRRTLGGPRPLRCVCDECLDKRNVARR